MDNNLTKIDYQRICQFLAKQPPFTIEITPLEVFLIIEILLHGIARVVVVNSAVTIFVRKLTAILGKRYPLISNAIKAAWMSQLKF